MKLSKSPMTTVLALGLAVPLALVACNQSGDGGDDEDDLGGGGGGGAGGGGGDEQTGGSSKGGSGGSSKSGGSTAKGGTGGGSSGGMGGAPAEGGSGGSGGGGSGGSAGTGGTTVGGTSHGKAICVDGKDPNECVFVEPKCIFRPDWPMQHQCGPKDHPLYMSTALKNDGFCGGKYNKDGIFGTTKDVPMFRGEVGDGTKLTLSPITSEAYNTAASGRTVSTPAPDVGSVYLPGGDAGYNGAADGKVALSFWFGTFSSKKDQYDIDEVHEYLVKRGEMPYTIVVYLAGDYNPPTWIDRLRSQVIPALKAKWPKISDDPDYRVIAGQSTTGAHAFDIAWMGTDVISRAIGGSPSLACFTCLGKGGCPTGMEGCEIKNDVYAKEIAFCPARDIRWSATVGTCDITSSVAMRTARGCGSGSGAGAVDASGCGADWLNMAVDAALALKEKGIPNQLFIVDKAGHVPNVWGGVALPEQLRWIFKDITCAN